MALVLSFPFRLGANGSVVEVEQFSARGSEEAMAHMIGTRRGERVYVPRFGIPDPTFSRVDPNDVRVSWRLFGDGRGIEAISSKPEGVDTQRVRVELAP